MSVFEKSLKSIRDAMSGTTIGREFLDEIRLSNAYQSVGAYYRKKLSNERQINPTQEMIEARRYFSENKHRIEKIKSFLTDRESRDCYQKMIDFRGTYNTDNFPYSNLKTQYFYHDFIEYGDQEVLVDCGGFSGDTIKSFMRVCKQQGRSWKRIVSFEPDPDMYKILDKIMSKYRNGGVILLPHGVWDMDTALEFYVNTENRAASTMIDKKNAESCGNKVRVSVKAIDSCEYCHDATFIKMDVEGSEYKALLGAQETIKRNRPRLAICIYHSDEDMLRLPELIHEMVPEYRLYVRHHFQYSTSETVLYAV